MQQQNGNTQNIWYKDQLILDGKLDDVGKSTCSTAKSHRLHRSWCHTATRTNNSSNRISTPAKTTNVDLALQHQNWNRNQVSPSVIAGNILVCQMKISQIALTKICRRNSIQSHWIVCQQMPVLIISWTTNLSAKIKQNRF
jgi:hypothetical protein